MIGLAAILHAAAIGPQGGYQLFTASGTFTVPAGVTSICAVAIGRGGPYFDDDGSGNTGAGGGGSLSYRNAIPTTPGEALGVLITGTVIDPYTEGSSILLRSGTTLLGAGAGRIPASGGAFAIAGSVGFGGGQGAYSDQGSGTMDGAGAGGFTSAGQSGNGTRTRRGGGGSNPFINSAGALAGASANLNGVNYGGGAAYGGVAGAGCVLIMWGDGFSFPSNIVSP